MTVGRFGVYDALIKVRILLKITGTVRVRSWFQCWALGGASNVPLYDNGKLPVFTDRKHF